MPTTPRDEPAAQPHVRGFEQSGGNLKRIAGHLRRLVSALHEFDPAINEANLGREAAERQRWFYEALLDAVDHEQDRLQALAPLASEAARAIEERERKGRP